MPISPTNNLSFEARLKIRDPERVLTKFHKEELREAASKVGSKKDFIKVELGDYYEGAVHSWAEQGSGWMNSVEDDVVNVDVVSKIGNKCKSEGFLGTGYCTTIADNIVERLTGYFSNLAGKVK